MWRGVAAITPNTAATNSNLTPGWNRSDMEFTNHTVRFFRRSGCPSAAGWCLTAPLKWPFPGFTSPRYFSLPIAASRRVIVTA